MTNGIVVVVVVVDVVAVVVGATVEVVVVVGAIVEVGAAVVVLAVIDDNGRGPAGALDADSSLEVEGVDPDGEFGESPAAWVPLESPGTVASAAARGASSATGR